LSLWRILRLWWKRSRQRGQGRVLLFAANDPITKIEFPASAVGIDEKEILGSYSAAVDIQESAAGLVLGRNCR